MTCMSAAGWFDDPRGAADQRWFDGEVWTDHVSTAGRAWTSPLDGEGAPSATGAVEAAAPGSRGVLSLASFVVARAAQPRGDGSSLDVYDDGGGLGRFVETEPEELAGSAVVRLVDASGAPVLSITHPGGAPRARVEGPSGVLGFLSRVGRVRANLELHGPGRKPEGEPLLVLKPLDDGSGWSCPGIGIRSWLLGSPTTTAYAEARYEVSIDVPVDDAVRPLLLALPVLVDRSLTQTQ